jgi:hypothetical protein
MHKEKADVYSCSLTVNNVGIGFHCLRTFFISRGVIAEACTPQALRAQLMQLWFSLPA